MIFKREREKEKEKETEKKVIILIHMFSSHLFYQMILWYIFDIDGFV